MAGRCGHVLLSSSSSLDFWKCQLENPCQALRETHYGITKTQQRMVLKVLCFFSTSVPSESLTPIVLCCQGVQQDFPGPCDLQENRHVSFLPKSDELCLVPTSLLSTDIFPSCKADAT